MQQTGKIIFVGAGPGHPDLMTIRARNFLRDSHIVVHDALVSPEILATISPEARVIPIPRSFPDGVDPGNEVGNMLVDLAIQGHSVIRLKGGDPSVFARLAEELQPIQKRCIPFEIVPGVTAALAAAAAAGIPVTNRTSASSATLITGHEADKEKSGLDFQALAELSGTVAIYMGVDQVAHWSKSLLDAGKTTDTPVTIVSRCSWPDQKIIVSSLGRCEQDFVKHAWQTPAVAILGRMAHVPSSSPANLPLSGKRILITRPRGQGETLSELIDEQGGICIHVPVIQIAPPPSWDSFDGKILCADSFDWLVFSSANGVRSFQSRMKFLQRDGRSLGSAQLAAVGPATAQALSDAGYVCDLIPDTYRAEALAAVLSKTPRGSRFLIIRAEQGREVLTQRLQESGHDVTEVIAYRSLPIMNLSSEERAMVNQNKIDWIVVSSPAVAKSAISLFGKNMKSWHIASISPLTSAALRSHGLQPTAEAEEASAIGLVNAMKAFEITHSEQSLQNNTSPSSR
ncbi:MAG: uroporphyrinogen-III C-methyltransferase [Pirellulales bacterium]